MHAVRMNRQQAAGILVILVAAMLWGTTGTAQSFAPLTLSSYWVGTGRLLVAAVFFALVLLCQQGRQPAAAPRSQLPWLAILCGGIGMAVYNLAFFAGVRATGVATGTAIALGSGPLWAGLLQMLLSGHRPRMNWWFALLIAVCGLVLTLQGSEQAAALSASGVALCLLSGLAYAVYALSTKHIVARASPAMATTTVFTLGALIALPLAFLLAGVPQLHVADIGVMLWLGVVATGLAYLLFSSGLRFVSSATGVALALAEPVTAVCLAIIVIGERPQMMAFLGLALILAGLALLIRAELQEQPA